MKILHLSDTHNCHRRLRDLPEADVVVSVERVESKKMQAVEN